MHVIVLRRDVFEAHPWTARSLYKAFEAALEETVRWYLANEAWWRPIREGRYAGERLGLAARTDAHPSEAGGGS